MPGSAVQIVDPDGGMAVQLRPGDTKFGALSVWSAPSGDRTEWSEVIDSAASGDVTIHQVAAGQTFHVEAISVTLKNAGAVILKSGSSTKLSGSVRVGASVPFSQRHPGVPLSGKAAGDHFVINLSGDAVMFPVAGGYVVGWDAT